MTRNKLTTIALVAVLLFAAVGATGVVSAREDTRTAVGNEGSALYLGEESLDVSNIDEMPDSGSATLVGVAGDTEGTIAQIDDVTSADISESNGFAPGGYAVDGSADDTVEVSVREAKVTEVELRHNRVPQGDDVTVEAEFNFEEVQPATVVVEDENGVDITNTLTSDALIETSGSTVTLDTDELDQGEYTVTVRGDDEFVSNPDTDLTYASASDTFEVTSADTEVTLNKEEVTRGEIVTGTLSGTPGEYVTVRIDVDDLSDESEGPFRATGDLEQSDTDAASYYLGDDGQANFQIESGDLEEDNTVDIEVVSTDTNAIDRDSSEDDSVDLRVNEEAITIDNAPSVVQIGEDWTVEGSAPEMDHVAVYALSGDTYYPLGDESVDTDGTFTVEDLPSSDASHLGIPGNYRITVVDANEVGDLSDTISQDALYDIDVKDSTTVRSQSGSLSVQVDSSNVAVDTGDEVTISGASVGNGESLRAYVLGPRGSVDSSFDSISVDDDSNFSEDTGSIFDNRGTYQIVVIGQGRDGDYATGSVDLGGSNTQEQNLEILYDAYEGAGVDDQVATIEIEAEYPSLTIDETDTVDGESVTLSGTSNRQDETTVFVEVLNGEDVVTSTDAEIDGSTNSWETTVESLDTGTYTVRADDGESVAETSLTVSDETVTETATDTPEETEKPTETDAQTESETVTETASETPAVTSPEAPTETEGPGFGIGVGLLALLGAGLLAIRRRN